MKSDNYSWDLEYVRNLQKLCKMYSLMSKTEEEKEELKFSAKGLEVILETSCEKSRVSIINLIKSDSKLFSEYTDQIKLVRTVRDNLKLEKDGEKYCYLPHSFDDCLDIAQDFYKSIDEDFYKYFLEILKDKDKIFNTNKNGSYIIFLPYFKNGLINIQKTNTILDFIATIHETMHLIELKMNSSNLINKKNKFIEICSQYIELLACDYMKKYPEFSVECDKAKYNFADKMQYASENLLIKKGIIEKVKNSEDYGKPLSINDIAKIITGSSTFDESIPLLITSILTEPTDMSIKHCTNFPYSLALYKKYQSDKNNSIKACKNYINSNKKDSIKMLENFEGQINEDVSEYCLSLRA